MRVEILNTRDVFRAKLSDKLLFVDSAAFRKLLETVRGSGCPLCELDISGLDVIDSAGLGMLMLAIEDARKNGWSLSLKGPQPNVRKLLQLSRIDQLLKVA